MQCILKIGDGEPGGACAGNELGDELGELLAALIGRGFDLLFGDEGAGSLLGVEDAADLHFAIGAGDGVGIDGEIDSDAAYGGELVAGAQDGGGDCGLDLVDELAVDGHAGVEVEAEGEFGLGEWLHGINVLVD